MNISSAASFERNVNITLSILNSSCSNQTDAEVTVSTNSSQIVSTSIFATILQCFLLSSSLVGSLANATVLCVLLSSKTTRGSTVNLFIINQTILDLLDCLLMVVFVIFGLSEVTHYSLILCLLFGGGFSTSSASNASALSLVMITLERYMKIVHPVFHRNHYRRWMTYVGIVLCWILGLSTGAQADFASGRNCLSIPIEIGKVGVVLSHFHQPTKYSQNHIKYLPKAMSGQCNHLQVCHIKSLCASLLEKLNEEYMWLLPCSLIVRELTYCRRYIFSITIY